MKKLSYDKCDYCSSIATISAHGVKDMKVYDINFCNKCYNSGAANTSSKDNTIIAKKRGRPRK